MAGSPIDDFLGAGPGSVWRRRLQWLAAALAVVTLVVLVGRFVSGGEVTRYATAFVRRGDLQAAVTGNGALQPIGQRSVVAGAAGVVGEILVRDGDQITSGQLLARLDPASMEAEIARDRTLIDTREAAMATAAANVRTVREQLSRFERVRRESGNRVPSEREMAAVRDDFRRATDGLRDAQIELGAAKLALADHQAGLALTEIRAPIDGVVIGRRVAIGQTVTAHDPAILEIAEPATRLRMDVMVERAAAQALRVGATAQVTSEAAPRRTFPATLVFMRPARSADTTQLVLSLDVQNRDRALRRGMMATARVGLGLRPDALVVPDEALRFARASDVAKGAAAEGEAVYVLGEQGAPRRVSVEVLGGDGRRHAVVSQGLQPGTPVITGLR